VHTSANGIPLGAGMNPAKQKMLMLDTGILQRLAGLNLTEILLENDFSLVNKGGIAENFAGLELLKATSCFTDKQLYYWQREKLNAHAEVDFLIQQGDKIIPIEVKSGTSGKMQSLLLFMKEKHSESGIRSSLENFSQYDKIEVYPLYAISQIMLH
jgi:predicted AAA+ superfamily ATPase